MREYFVEKNGRMECKSCGENVSNYVTNLKRHLKQKHNEIFKELSKKLKVSESEDMESKVKITVEISKEEVITSCISMITKESLPLSFLDSTSFKTLTSQLFDGLHMQRINSRNIMDVVAEKALQIKEAIKHEIKNKIFCLKMDTATRNERSILGVNIQIITKGEIKIFSLGMIELKQRHTAEHIKDKIENILNEYGISKKQIYAVTTDNGRNMVKAVELLSSQITQLTEEEEDDDYDDDDETNDFENSLSMEFENIMSIKCAAHTLQLAVKDFLKEYGYIIEKARKIVKILRSPSFR